MANGIDKEGDQTNKYVKKLEQSDETGRHAHLVHLLKEAHRLVVWWRLGERGVDVVHVQRTLRVTNCQAPPVARPANTTDDNQ